MERLDRTAVHALKGALDAQPLTEAKVAFAWAIAAGPTLARAGRVKWVDGTLEITATSPAWQRELSRAKTVILARVGHLIGTDAVRQIRILDPATEGNGPSAPAWSHAGRPPRPQS